MSDDFISRQAAIIACENGICSCVSDCVDEIRELPSAILKTKNRTLDKSPILREQQQQLDALLLLFT